ncbi:Membrane protein [Thermococcus onnurineus NA1]|uniref:Membrane protein n=1 Tax=Thermococcus onnurineus (strain NA1) TaxID=523850 RepID=B6YSJ6_THEON|nr:hypothetical protein [Thermococcus onnurineus]ACJ15533.1 Membrane protein [Thermococcus onnurineus NA1]
MVPEVNQAVVELLQNPSQVNQYLPLLEFGLLLITPFVSWAYKLLRYIITPYRTRNRILRLISKYDYYVFCLLQDLEVIPKNKRAKLLFYNVKRHIILIFLLNAILFLLYFYAKFSFIKIVIIIIWIIAFLTFMIVGGLIFPLFISKLSERNIRRLFWVYFVSMFELSLLILVLLKKDITAPELMKILLGYYGMIVVMSYLIWRLIKSELYIRYKHSIQRSYQNKLPFVIISTKNGLHKGYLHDIVSSQVLTLKTGNTFIPIFWENIDELEIIPRFFIEP